ncbi:MAG: flagellar hook-basal body complex protein, partial [Thermanaeromonas sp.]|uniref:flagellar hook-basal body complex protein n=1 Tax=Thermanaeromonas sp. TaxID=2003697 RepID=UPI00243DA5E9
RSTVTFKDVFYQTLRGGSQNSVDTQNTGLGGTNPQQIGLGVTLNSIDVIHTQGAAAYTGNGTDLMIQGDGFFVVTDGNNYFYTRAGAFHFDDQGYLVNADGMRVQALDDQGNLVDIKLGVAGSDTFSGFKGSPSNGVTDSFSIDSKGIVHIVVGTNKYDSYPLAIAKFPNPAGLEKIGSNLYSWATAAGGRDTNGNFTCYGTADSFGTTIIPSALEMSNVELAQEFTDMIITQRGFQANARTITTSDEMLQELVNLKR